MRKDMGGVMTEVKKFVKTAGETTEVDVNKLDHNKVKIPKTFGDNV